MVVEVKMTAARAVTRLLTRRAKTGRKPRSSSTKERQKLGLYHLVVFQPTHTWLLCRYLAGRSFLALPCRLQCSRRC